MLEDAPRTTRPNHPVVEALESQTFLDLMFRTLAPGIWAVETDNGFWWIPHRLRHDIEIIEVNQDPANPMWSCRSTFLLCSDIDDPSAAMGMCDYINQRGLGGAAWFDFDERSIKFTSSVRLEPWNWFGALMFFHAVPRLVGQLEHFAVTLAELVGGKVPDAVHPTRGARDTPDQFLSEVLLATEQPETACGLWWSPREIEAFRRALRYQLQNSDSAHLADRIDPTAYDDDLTTAENLRLEVFLESGDSDLWTALMVGEGRHPEYGYGIEMAVTTSLLFGDDLDHPEGPTSHPLSVLAVNVLNAHQHFTCEAEFGMGAWMTWRGEVVHETFLYPEAVAVLQHLAGNHAGEAVAILAGQCMNHLSTLWGLYDAITRFAGEPVHLEERRWNGIGMNAGHYPLFGSADELYREMYSTYPLNQLIEPVELDRSGMGLATEATLATMGIFNPIGPTVGSIEVAINYRLGAALLLERSRHPHSPSVRVHAVLDQHGFNNVDRLLEPLVARLQWSGFDWWDTRAASERDVAAMMRGLRTFAERHPDYDYGRQALELLETRDPWARLDSRFEPATQLPTDFEDPIGLWIAALTNPATINGHYAFIRSAWEGATAWLDGALRGDKDPAAEAQLAADRVRYSVWSRITGEEPPPPAGT